MTRSPINDPRPSTPSPDRQVAIIGRCESTLKEAPLGDADWECWGLAWDVAFMGERYFEIHTPNTWTEDTISPAVDYRTWLRELDGRKVMAEAYADIPGSEPYPLEGVLAMPGMESGYLESSIAYMLAMAKFENVPRMGIWGVELATSNEYRYQRPNLAYLMGLFRYQGMEIRVPRASALWTLSLLDASPVPDFMDEKAERFHLEYLLGRETALAIERGVKRPTELRADLMSSLWTDPPRYGLRNLDEAKIKSEAA